MEVSASGYIKELHEDFEQLSDDESESKQGLDTSNDPEEKISEEPSLQEAVEEKTIDHIEVETTKPLRDEPLPEKVPEPVREPFPLNSAEETENLTELKTEYGPELIQEPFLEGEDVAELSEMLTDWSGIKAKSRGAASVASMSTIHPDVIKQRVKKTITKRQNVQAVQRIRAKGEASAATRKKRENKELIRADGIWGWDN